MTDDQQKAIDLITQAATLLGWQIAFPGGDEEVSYVILAAPEVIDVIVTKIEG